MKKLVALFVMFFCCSSFGFIHPEATVSFNRVPPSTVFYGETLYIPVKLTFFALRHFASWSIPIGSYLQAVSGVCPPIPFFHGARGGAGTCNMNLVIAGDRLGKVISGQLNYQVWGEEYSSWGKELSSRGKEFRYRKRSWNDPHPSPGFYVTVIPHNLSMLPIPIQEATANQRFVYNLKSAVNFYQDNADAGKPAQGIVKPIEKDGLSFDPRSFSIVGTPTRTGTYSFTVGATNANGTTEAVDFKVQVNVNPKDKPVFKQPYSIKSALPDQKYSMNLMELIKPRAGFMESNQISFRIDTTQSKPHWLNISKEDANLLVGNVPPEAAGQNVEVTLIATSNTGGDSKPPLTVTIPVAYDPAKKPIIEPFELEKLVGTNIYENLSSYIKDPAHDSNLKVILEKVEPAATWLTISDLNPTVLEGTVPDTATGIKYKLTLKASTSVGGSSESVVIPLKISIDEKQAPRFKAATPLLPMLYPGQPFFYDFVANNDIYPDYNEAHYEIKFAEDFTPPTWLHLEGNKLFADSVEEYTSDEVNIKIRITNTPGGPSGVYLLSLNVMN